MQKFGFKFLNYHYKFFINSYKKHGNVRNNYLIETDLKKNKYLHLLV